jgi:hypothetical protein
MKLNRALPLSISLFAAWTLSVSAWDYEIHRIVNQLALASLPTNFPAFVHEAAAAERIAFLAGEPDRWRNVPDLTFRHATGPDHYIDLEELADYELSAESLPQFRADFIAKLALVRQANPARFPAIDPARNQDRTRELVGMLPWAMTENYAKLKSGFSCLQAFEQDGGTAEEIANAKANVVYIMGIMGHFAGDASQPLHSTVHHHGWVGENPNGYTTNRNIHSWIDGGYFAKVGRPELGALKMKLRPARPLQLNGRDARTEQVFRVMVQFVAEQQRLVEQLYRLEREGRLSGNGTRGLEGKAFLEAQLVKSAQLLGDTWLSGFEQAPSDTFLKSYLAKRKK